MGDIELSLLDPREEDDRHFLILAEHPELQEAVLSILEQADSYDRNLFEAMGVKTIWVEDYDDIPALLEQIPAG